MNSRRAILKLIGTVPAGAIAAKGEIAAMLASPAVAAATALAGGSIGSDTLPSPAGGHLGLIGKQLNRLRRQADAQAYAKQLVRINGLDPDIAAFRSVSAVHRRRLQSDRDIDHASFMQHLDKVLYGE